MLRVGSPVPTLCVASRGRETPVRATTGTRRRASRGVRTPNVGSRSLRHSDMGQSLANLNSLADVAVSRVWVVAWQWSLLVLLVALPLALLPQARSPALRYWV